MNIFSQNKKIKNSGNDSAIVINFGIPAFKSSTGLKTCPMAGQCAKGCYATQGTYRWRNVASVFEQRLQLTLQASWAPFEQELHQWRKRADRQSKQLIVRWHDSGDFYNIAYINKALKFFSNNSDVQFYAYTKMVPIFKQLQAQGKIPSNFTIIYSFGGLADSLIDVTTDRHSAVFSSLDALRAAGYSDTTENDLTAIGPNHKVGLVYHGYKSTAWTTIKTA